MTGFACCCCCRRRVLTESVTRTVGLAAPVAGARSVGPRPRETSDVRSVLAAARFGLLAGRPASLLCSDQRLHREGVRFDAEGARSSPLLCHVPCCRGGGDEERGRTRCHRCAGNETSSKTQGGSLYKNSTGTVRCFFGGATLFGPRTSRNNATVIRGSGADFGQSQQTGFTGETEGDLPITAGSNQSTAITAPPKVACWSRPLLRGPLVLPYGGTSGGGG